jgi:nicotinate-nucleotide adenylyltransferase
MKPIGILGGTFDPVHNGHLRLALEALDTLGLDQVRFVPLSKPNHRADPTASVEQRTAMLKAALVEEPRLVLDDRELRRGGVSYTVDTLQSLREEFPQSPLALLLGADAFVNLEQWDRWEQLLELGHLVVAGRPGHGLDLSPVLDKLHRERRNDDPKSLMGALSGKICHLFLPSLSISSSAIRNHITTGRSVRYLLPDTVVAIIKQEGLYQNGR